MCGYSGVLQGVVARLSVAVNGITCYHRWRSIFESQQPKVDRDELMKRLEAVRSQLPALRQLCTNCGRLLLTGEEGGHEGHSVRRGVTDVELQEPTTLLCPVDDRKSQAVRGGS